MIYNISKRRTGKFNNLIPGSRLKGLAIHILFRWAWKMLIWPCLLAHLQFCKRRGFQLKIIIFLLASRKLSMIAQCSTFLTSLSSWRKIKLWISELAVLELKESRRKSNRCPSSAASSLQWLKVWLYLTNSTECERERNRMTLGLA